MAQEMKSYSTYITEPNRKYIASVTKKTGVKKTMVLNEIIKAARLKRAPNFESHLGKNNVKRTAKATTAKTAVKRRRVSTTKNASKQVQV